MLPLLLHDVFATHLFSLDAGVILASGQIEARSKSRAYSGMTPDTLVCSTMSWRILHSPSILAAHLPGLLAPDKPVSSRQAPDPVGPTPPADAPADYTPRPDLAVRRFA